MGLCGFSHQELEFTSPVLVSGPALLFCPREGGRNDGVPGSSLGLRGLADVYHASRNPLMPRECTWANPLDDETPGTTVPVATRDSWQ